MRRDISRWRDASLWIILLAAFIVLRLVGTRTPLIGDELIPLRVFESMQARGVLDPNWRLADLPAELKYDQYNFYFYNILAFLVLKLAGLIGLAPFGALRITNILLQGITVILIADIVRRLGLAWWARLFAGALFVFAPGAVQDVYLARPESLLYFLAALFVWVLALDLPLIACMVASGILIGFGAAVKISFASLAVLAIIPLAGKGGARGALQAVAASCILGLAAVAGFCAAAPYAVVHLDTYFAGLRFLEEQYRNGHPPHSLPQYGFGTQALWIARYFLELYGPLWLIALAAPLWLTGRLRLWAIALAASWLLLAVFFATQSVFFERNLAHALVPLLLAAAIGVSALKPVWLRSAATLVMLVPMAYWSSEIALTMKSAPGWLRYEAAHQITPSQRIDYAEILAGTMPQRCDTVAVVDYNDPRSERYRDALRQAGYMPIGEYDGRFAWLVTSTLHTYLDPNFHYFRCP